MIHAVEVTQFIIRIAHYRWTVRNACNDNGGRG
jgi:hypothetical protein